MAWRAPSPFKSPSQAFPWPNDTGLSQENQALSPLRITLSGTTPAASPPGMVGILNGDLLLAAWNSCLYVLYIKGSYELPRKEGYTKKIMALAGVLLIAPIASAQNWFKGTLDEAVAKAKSENKLVLIDFFSGA